jgi:hypothetical protein
MVGSCSILRIEQEISLPSSKLTNRSKMDSGHPKTIKAFLPNSLARSPMEFSLPDPKIILLAVENSNCIYHSEANGKRILYLTFVRGSAIMPVTISTQRA